MSLRMITLGIILIAAVVLLLANRLRPDVIALGVALALGLTGVVTPEESLSGFSHPAVLTLIALFAITQGLTQRGATRLITSALSRLGRGDETRLLVGTMVGGAFLSLFMNNVAAAAVLLPPVSDAAARARVPPARLMMPLAFATCLGGMATLLTTGNLVVSAALQEAGYRPYGLLDFVLVGLPIVVAGILYMVTVGRRLLSRLSDVDALAAPEPKPELTVQYALRERVVQFRVGPEAAIVGKTLGQSELGSRLGLTVMAIQRRGRFIWTPGPDEAVRSGDALVVVGRAERTSQVAGPGIVVESPDQALAELEAGGPSWIEVVLPPRSRYVGQTLRELGFRGRYEANVVAIWHGGRSVRTDVANLALQHGDALLIHAGPRSLSLLRRDSELLVLRSEQPERLNPAGAALSAFIFAATLLVAAVGWLPPTEAMMLGFLATVLTRRISMEEAYRAIDWRVIFVVAGMLPLSIGMIRTGLGAEAGRLVVGALSGFGPLAVAAGLLVITLLLSQALSAQVVAVIMAPIAIGAARSLGADPRAMAMIVALASGASFLTPTAHPVNLLVMGAGNYRASDYARVGLGLAVLVSIVILVVSPLVYPF